MNEPLLAAVIREYCEAISELLTDAAILETAMYLEDTFGLSLDDGDITEANLGSFSAIVSMVTRKLHLKANLCVGSAE